MKYKVTKVEVDGITVEYEDNAWALIPILKTDTEQDIKGRIREYATKETFSKTSDVPLAVGFEADTVEEVTTEEVTYTYKQARAANYPQMGDQLDALHWARQGDDTQSKAVDEAIKAVKAKYPKDDTVYKAEDL